MSDTIALNDIETVNLSDKLTIYSTEIETSLNNMCDIISKMSTALEGEISNSIKSKFSYFESQFPQINDNIQSYIQDFKNLVIDFTTQDASTRVESVNQVSNEGGDVVNVNM